MPDVAVLLVNYNGMPYLLDALRSLDAQTLRPAEIVVVDNGSSDDSVERVRAELPHVRLIASGRNDGFAEGCNLGWRATTAPYVALLNSDAEAEPRWLEELVAAMERHRDAGAAMGKIYFAGSDRVFDQAGALFNNIANYWGRAAHERDGGQFDREEEVPGLTACAAMIRRDAVDGDLFDGTLFMYGEELDLTLRLRGAGKRIVFTPGAIVWHRGMESVRKVRGDAPRLFQQFHASRNRLKLLARYYPLRVLASSAVTIALSVIYWDLVFLRRAGVRFFARAVVAQLRFLIAGLRQRDTRNASRWLPWMTRHSLRALRRHARAQGDPG